VTDYRTIAESNNFIVLDKYTQQWEVAESATVKLLLDHLKSGHGFWRQQGA
jgi:hypothetical protein